jgi:ATP-dependent DNA helicase RecG
MLAEELIELVEDCVRRRCETPDIELKKAKEGTPRRLYDTLSAFANQVGGGIILFGIDQESNYEITGVYDPQDLQIKVTEQANQMEPVIRPLFTVAEIEGKMVVSAEISECDVNEKPCYYRGAGKTRGSYTRVGDADLPMTEYEIYGYEVFKRKIQDELRDVPEGISSEISDQAMQLFLAKIRMAKPNLSKLPDADILTLSGLQEDGKPTLAGLLLFGLYPQARFQGYCITAVVVPGLEVGTVAEDGARFTDNKRIEGTIPELLEGAMSFMHRNMKVRTIIDENGKRADKTEYPQKAIREIILNALIHRDYSFHTETSPIRLLLFSDRVEIENPGGLYGRLTLGNLGKTGTDIRNPAIAAALEILIDSENRFSNIPTIRNEMAAAALPEPVFESSRGVFRVTLYNSKEGASNINTDKDNANDITEKILQFCRSSRTREDLAKELNLSSISYMMNRYINPLLDAGKLKMTNPEKPRSRHQRYCSDNADIILKLSQGSPR